MVNELFNFSPRQTDAQITVTIANCFDVIPTLIAAGTQFDAIITDPPYEIGYMDKAWDTTGVAFSADHWQQIASVLKPGGFLVAFAMARLYHKLATALESIGFETYPMLHWLYRNGLPKPMNVANLFDRDNNVERTVIGSKKGSGYTAALVKHGVQNYSSLEFPVYESAVSAEAKEWNGFFYGVNTLKPAIEPIYIGRKPLATPRVIDNLRQHRTGALNIGALRERRYHYPTTIFEHAKARYEDHESDHPTVKPVRLMEELVLLTCPPGGHVLDCYGGTGTTAVACRNLGYDCTVIEANPAMEEIIRKRLRLEDQETC